MCSIPNQCCGSWMFIPDPNYFLSRIPDPHQRIFIPKKLFLRSRKYDPVVHPGSGSRIRILIFYPSRDPGSRGLKSTGSRIHIKEFKYRYFISKKLFLSSRKYAPGCSPRILILDLGVKKAPDPGCATLSTIYESGNLWSVCVPTGNGGLRIHAVHLRARASHPAPGNTEYMSHRRRLN